MLAVIVALIASSPVLAGNPPQKFCKKDSKSLPYGWVSGQTIGTLKQQSQFLIANTSLDLYCSGSVVVLNDCQFMIKDFTYTDPSTTAWFAGYANDPTNGVRFAAENVPTSNNANSPTFTLVQVVGAAYAWTSIDQLRLFDTANQQLICTADLAVSGSSTSSSSSGSSSSNGGSTSSGSGSSGSDSSAASSGNTGSSAAPNSGSGSNAGGNSAVTTQKGAAVPSAGGNGGAAKSEAFQCVVAGLNMLMATVFLV
ncbi:hypothetical protein BDR26DRAFT_858067 [Obelidium mucronatum]|nr:hypothetical protein BDR26DRAFT_858067 [Obelidium mucronatum]